MLPIPLQSGGAGGAFLIMLILFVLSILLVFWVYIDAQENSTNPAFLWAIVVFLAPLLGLVIYLLLGRDDQTYSQSPQH